MGDGTVWRGLSVRIKDNNKTSRSGQVDIPGCQCSDD